MSKDSSLVNATISVLEKYHALMIYRLKNKIYDQKSLLVIEEYCSILDDAKALNKKLRSRIKFLVNDIAKRGSTAGCRLALVSQSHQTSPTLGKHPR